MLNEDVIDLYGRIGVGTKVIVLRTPGVARAAAASGRVVAHRTIEVRAASIY
jgi:hypothetical protein